MCVAHCGCILSNVMHQMRFVLFKNFTLQGYFVDGLGLKYFDVVFAKPFCVYWRYTALTTTTMHFMVVIMKFRQRFFKDVESVYIATGLISFKLVYNYSSLAKYTSLLCGLLCIFISRFLTALTNNSVVLS